MERQHIENLLRRHKGQLVSIRTISAAAYKGSVNEITNDYVSLVDRESEDETETFVLFEAMESFVITDPTSPK
jgi:hypothetical protein